MSIFGDFYKRKWRPLTKATRSLKRSSEAEKWQAALMGGSSELGEAGPANINITWLFGALCLLVGATLIARLMWLQIISGQHNVALAASNHLRVQTISAPRGAMYDRNGHILVRNLAQYDVAVLPVELPLKADQRANIYAQLASMISQPLDGLKANIEKNGLSSVMPIVVAEKIDRELALNITERLSQMPGVSVETNPAREYLQGTSLPHIIGYIGRISPEEWQQHSDYRQIDVIGKSGLEQSYESELKGKDGKEQVEVDVTGKPIKYLARVEPEAGHNLVLSIDTDLQQKATEALTSALASHGSHAGAIVALQPNTGEVLAAVNAPSYDGNLFAKGISQADYKSLVDNPDKPLFNRVLNGGYPIGSTIKPFVSIAGLQENIINTSTTVEDKGKLDVPNQYNPSIVYTFKGWKPEGLGVVNVYRAIAWSSDIFFYMVGGGFQSFKGLGVDKLTSWYRNFGFGSKTGIDISGESAGFVPGPEAKKKYSTDPWYVGDTYNISIGQGDLRATPLQLANATAVVANGGQLMKPHLVKQIQSSTGQPIRDIAPEVLRKDFISPANIAIVRQGMEQTVELGTACCRIKAEVPVKVAAKTGTAETSSEGFDGKNPRTKPHAWFSAYAPAANPQIVLVVLVENSGEGADVAGPVAREILKWYFSR